MKENLEEKKAALLGSIKKNSERLRALHASLKDAFTQDIPLVGKTDRSALMVAGLIENYYTCLETIFLRISQFFENNLTQERWHSDLLEKMTFELENIRIPAVSDENYPRLLELLKFRHFRRYYFELEYDWDRLEYLTKKLNQAHPTVLQDLTRFTAFLRSL